MTMSMRLWLSVLALSAGAVALTCGSEGIDLTGFPCDGGACVEGYVCNHEVDRCGPKIPIGCAGVGNTCPSGVRTGRDCPSVDTFIPCADGLPYGDCSHGCRSCQEDLTWGSCSYFDCQIGTATNCAFCGNTCSALPNVATASCDDSGRDPVCNISACDSGYDDTDGNPDNGCEAEASGGR